MSVAKMFICVLDAGRMGVRSKFATSTARAGKLFPPLVDRYSNFRLFEKVATCAKIDFNCMIWLRYLSNIIIMGIISYPIICVAPQSREVCSILPLSLRTRFDHFV
jgi:hypothetical protein